MPDPQAEFRSGFVTLIGAPNVGKSTLLNRILGEKISITSKRPQTTRNRILGVLHRPASQMVFLDTPGIHRAKKPLNRRIVDVAMTALDDADLVLLVVDLVQPQPDAEQVIVDRLRGRRRSVVLALNKTDRVSKNAVLTAIDRWAGRYAFAAVVPTSAKHGHQVEDLILGMEHLLPQGPPYFPQDTLTDLPERFVAAEIVREKVFRLTGEEIPYAAAVTVESFTEATDRDLVRIGATIHVERESQKGILIGKSGAKLKQIGQAAREDIERLLGCKVYLRLFVRVQKNWSGDTRALRRFGY